MTFKIETYDYESSAPETRVGPMAHAYALANRGSYYKVRAIDPVTGVVAHEWAADPRPGYDGFMVETR